MCMHNFNVDTVVVPRLRRNGALAYYPSTSPLRGYAQDERHFSLRFSLSTHPERSVSGVEGSQRYAQF
jgi:hypothetical protein